MCRWLLLFAVALPCTSIGCAVGQAHSTQDQIRCSLLDLYTDQVMDNIVRTHNRLPIVQLDYTQAQGMITVKNTASVGDNQTWTKTNVLSLPALTRMITKTSTNVLNGSLGLENTNQITIAAVPVTTSNEVYDAYIQFLSLPGSLVQTAEPPSDGAAHICRKYDDCYYWVPTFYRDQFFELALLSTVQRGKSLLPQDVFFAVNVTDILGDPEPVGVDPDAVRIILKLDKKVPNDDGHLIFTEQIPNAQYPFGKYTKNLKDPSMEQVPPLSMTDRIGINFEKNQLETLKSQLMKAPKPAKLRLHHHQPSPPSTEELLQRANFQLQQFNQNIVR